MRTPEGRIRLNTNGSLKDIKNIQLYNGLKVILNDADELEAEGIIEYSESEKIWVAKIDWDKIKNF